MLFYLFSNDLHTNILVEFASSELSMAKFCAQKRLARSTLKCWLDGNLPAYKRSSRGRKPYLPDVEKAVAEWVKSERTKGKAIWKKDVAEKAVAVARANGNSTFQGSDGYIANFMHQLSIIFAIKDSSGENNYIYRQR